MIDLVSLLLDVTEYVFESWFTVAVSAADSAATETDRSRRLGSVSGDTRKTLHRKLKNSKKITTNLKKM